MVKPFPTIATDIPGVWHMEIAVDGKDHICHEQDITDIVERGDAENDIVNGTHNSQSTQVEHTLSPAQLPADIVDTGQYDHRIAHTEQRKIINGTGTEKGLSVG